MLHAGVKKNADDVQYTYTHRRADKARSSSILSWIVVDKSPTAIARPEPLGALSLIHTLTHTHTHLRASTLEAARAVERNLA